MPTRERWTRRFRWTLVAACALGLSCGAPPARGAVAGVFDAVELSRPAPRMVSLAGEWRFYPGVLLSPTELDRRGVPARLLTAPGSWNPEYPRYGCGVYRLRITAPQDRPLALYIPNVHSAYTLYLNGARVLQVGAPSCSAAESRAQFRPTHAQIPAGAGEIDLAIAVSNHEHRNGGLWKAPQLGPAEQINAHQEQDGAFAWIQFGLYLGLAVLFLALYSGSPRQRELLFFSLTCMLVGLRAIVTENRALVQLWPESPFEFDYTLEYLTFFLTPVAFTALIVSIFPAQRRSRLLRGALYVLASVAALLTLLALGAPATIYTHAFPAGLAVLALGWLISLVVLVRAALDRERDALWILAAAVAPLAGVVNDYLHNNNVIESAYLATPTLTVFYVCFAALLGLRVRRIEKEREAIAAENAARNDFFSSMSHELRTPLNALLGMMQLLQETSLDRVQREYLKIMQGGGETLLTLVNEILDLARLEAGRLDLNAAPFDLRRMLAESLDFFRGQAAARRLELRLALDEDLPASVVGDAPRIRQALTNLLGNAIKFTETGVVSLEARARPLPDDQIQLEVSVIDTGPGIPREKHALIFERFGQASADTAARFGGSGLGLAISRRLARAMGGDISLESEPGKGSRFTLRLPLQRDRPTGAPRSVDAAPPEAQAPWDDEPALRILVADDDPAARLLMERFLAGVAAELTIVENGGDAIARFEPGRFDVVLLDNQMPDISGFEAVRVLREKERAAGAQPARMIAVTASCTADDVGRALAAGFDTVTPKPVQKAQLLLSLRVTRPGAHVV